MDRVLIVTGGSRGIGAAVARLAAAQGYAVCISYLHNRAAAEQVVDAIAGKGGRAIAVQADVSVEEQVVVLSASGAKHAPRIVDTAHQYQKPVTLLTNTANAPAQMQLNNAADRVYVFPKNREPYTYNTSTYLGMILSPCPCIPT